MAKRFLEIDALRGMAVVLMVVFHFLFDYNFFITFIVNLDSGFWFIVGRATAVLFVSLAGLSLTLHAHRKSSMQNRPNEWKMFARRGIFILSLGLMISLITFALFPTNAIWFGVLHLMGISFVLGAPFLHRKNIALAGGLVITSAGILLATVFHSDVPFWPILFPVSFSTFDYFPLFPWFGIFLLGIAAGHYFYPRGVPHPKLGWEKGNALVRMLALLGKKSLVIYFVHQPILIGIILVLKNMMR